MQTVELAMHNAVAWLENEPLIFMVMYVPLSIVSKPESVNFHPVNATAVTVSWNGSSIFSTWLHFISCYNATGAVLSQYNTLIPPGKASNIVTVEDDLTLTDSKEEIKHSFSLRFNITLQGTPQHGPTTFATFMFGMH